VKISVNNIGILHYMAQKANHSQNKKNNIPYKYLPTGVSVGINPDKVVIGD
jgi:hypothetical protein